MSEEIVKEIGGITDKDLRKIKEDSEKAFGKIFEGREKARQRVVYDFLNYIKTNNRAKFLDQILKLLNAKIEEEVVRNLVENMNTLFIQYDTPENFERIGYTIIMGIMSTKIGGD